jgi:hypothetical protein
MDTDKILHAVRGLSYQTSKFTKIVDYRLALFYFFCQLACLIGVVVSLLLGKTFLLTETPIGGTGTFHHVIVVRRQNTFHLTTADMFHVM